MWTAQATDLWQHYFHDFSTLFFRWLRNSVGFTPCDKMVSMASRLKFFDAMITSVVCFAARHRKIYTNDLRKLDAHCRKLLRRVVGPPADIDWNQPWHTILHSWHNRIDQQLKYHGLKIWSAKYLSEYWKFENYVALLDENRWVKRILHWNAGGGRPGRSFFQWQTPIQHFCRWPSIRRLA